MAASPNNTFKAIVDLEGEWLHDVPFQRQYPRFCCNAKEPDARAANRCPVCRCHIRDGWCTPGYRGVHIRQWIYYDDVITPIFGSNTLRMKGAKGN